MVSESAAAGDVSGQVDGLCMLARVALRRGELDRVARLAREAHDLARDSNQPRLERMPIHLQAVAARMGDDPGRARDLYRQSIALNEQLDERRMVAAEYRNLAYVELHDDNPALARQLFSLSAELARACGYDALEPCLLMDAAVLAMESGDSAGARRLVAEADVAFAAAGQNPDPDDAAELAWLRGRLKR